MRHTITALAILVGLVGLPPTIAVSAEPEAVPAPGERVNFVACPVVRDTKTVPVWLAEYAGTWYYLGIQQDIGAEFHPPQLKHDVLVEGTVSDEPKICGAIVLKPLSISVLRELNCNCNTILPAEEGMDAPDAPRPAGPSTRREPAERPAERPARPARPSAPFQPREFQILFSFDDDFLPGRSTRILSEAAAYAEACHAASIEVHGYRGTTLLSNGRDLVERPEIAAARADKIGQLLTGLGLPAQTIVVSAKNNPEPGDGLTDPQKRRVMISIKP